MEKRHSLERRRGREKKTGTRTLFERRRPISATVTEMWLRVTTAMHSYMIALD